MISVPEISVTEQWRRTPCRAWTLSIAGLPCEIIPHDQSLAGLLAVIQASYFIVSSCAKYIEKTVTKRH